MDDAVRTIGRFLWKFLLVAVAAFAVMAVIGAIARLLFGLDAVDVATASSTLTAFHPDVGALRRRSFP
jgi:ABC-type transporter Mla subunit MlaD